MYMCTYAHLNQHSGKDETGSYLLYWREIFIGKIEFFFKKISQPRCGGRAPTVKVLKPLHILSSSLLTSCSSSCLDSIWAKQLECFWLRTMTYMLSLAKYLKILRFLKRTWKPRGNILLPDAYPSIAFESTGFPGGRGGLLPLQPHLKAFVFLFSLKPCVLPQSQHGARA